MNKLEFEKLKKKYGEYVVYDACGFRGIAPYMIDNYPKWHIERLIQAWKESGEES